VWGISKICLERLSKLKKETIHNKITQEYLQSRFYARFNAAGVNTSLVFNDLSTNEVTQYL